MFDTELEITLKNMKNIAEFFKTNEDPERGWIWNPIKLLGGTEEKNKDKKNNKTPGIQKVLVDSS